MRAPSKVHHLVAMLKSKGREVEPVLNLDTDVWTIEISEAQECSDLIHMGLESETDQSYADCSGKQHELKVILVFRKVGKKGNQRWKTKASVSIDGLFTLEVPLGVIMALFNKPVAAHGDGKVGGGDSKAPRPMDVRQRTTITRV